MRTATVALLLIILLLPGGQAQADAARVPVDFVVEHQVDAGASVEHNCDAGPCGDTDEQEYCGSGLVDVRDDGLGFSFSEGGQSTGCAQVHVVLPVPAGSEQVTVRFWADRTIDHTEDTVGQQVGVDAAQEVLAFLSGTGSQPASVPVYEPSAGSQPGGEHEVTFNLGLLGQEGGTLTLAWLFSDGGVLGSQEIPALGGGVAFQATVRDVRVQLAGTMPEPAATSGASRHEADGRTVETFTLDVPLPAYSGPPSLGDVTVRLDFDLEAHEVELFTGPGPGGSRVVLPLGAIETDEDAFPARVSVTQDYLVVPAGSYLLEAVYEVPRDETDVSWLPFLVLALPAVAGVFASRNVHLYRARARGPYVRTARALGLVGAAAWSVYAALLIIALAIVGRDRMSVLPPDTATLLIYAQVAVVLLGFLILWHLGGRSYLHAMQHDLARRDAQEQELQRSNEELERFAYVASHDLQEPLRKVAASTMMLKRRYGDKIDAGADKWIGYAVDGAHRMQAMVQSLLTYSRAGQGDLDYTDVALEGLVDEIIDDLEDAIKARGARVTRGDLPTVYGDRMRLRQVLQNLIQNGLKYQPDDGSPEVHVEAKQSKGGWDIAVQDNGIGIPADKAEEVFEPFRRLHARSAYEGTGIGLAICSRIVERHGGRIWVGAGEGGGSAFHVWLPAGRGAGEGA